MYKFKICLAAMVLVSCGQGAPSNPNEVFVDALLDKHFTRPDALQGAEIPQKTIDSMRDCARPSLLSASKGISEEDKARILVMVESANDLTKSYEPNGGVLEVYQPLAEILGECLMKAHM
jgi:hypothetical protein